MKIQLKSDLHRIVSSVFALASSARALFAQSHYAVVDLGTLGGTTSQAFCVNADSAIVGTADTTNGLPHAFLNSGCSTAPTCRARPTPR
jgi:probable HAF family extracellular repeat protein